MSFDSAIPAGGARMNTARSPSLLRLRMLELAAGLRTCHLPQDIVDELQCGIVSLRNTILASPAFSLADSDAKARTAREIVPGGAHGC